MSDQIQVENLNFDRDTNSFEIIGTTISNKNFKTRLIKVFRPPANSATCFLDEFEYLLDYVSRIIVPTFFCGDYNIHVLKSNSITYQYISLLHGFGYTINNSLPTRILSETCIDHVISQAYQNTYTIKTSLTDHFGLVVQIDFQITFIASEDQLRKNLPNDTAILIIIFAFKQDLDQLSIENFI